MEILYQALAITGMFSLIVLSHEFGHYLAARKVGVKVKKFSLGFGPAILTKKIGETEFVLSLVPIGGYINMTGEDPKEEVHESEQHYSFQNQSLLQRSIIVLAGPAFNIVLALFLYVFVYYFGINVPAPEIATVEEGSPADMAGMKPGDVISELNGVRTTIYENAIRIIQENPGREMPMVLLRDSREISTTVMPVNRTGYGPFGRSKDAGYLGVSSTGKLVVYRQGLITSIKNAFKKAWEMISLTFAGVILLIKGQLPLTQLGGPIMMAKATSTQLDVGFQNFIFSMAFISVNLGIFNLLPVPALDGGYIMFFLIEKIIGRPLKPKTMQLIQKIGFSSLIFLIVFVFYNDIMKLMNLSL